MAALRNAHVRITLTWENDEITPPPEPPMSTPLNLLAQDLHARWAAIFRDCTAWDDMGPDEQGDWCQFASALVLGSVPNLLRAVFLNEHPDKSTPQPSQLPASRIDELAAHLWHISQHNRMPINLAARIQQVTDEIRQAAGLPKYELNTFFPDSRFQQCSVHLDGLCPGQHTHQS